MESQLKSTKPPLDPHALRQRFPLLAQSVYGKPLVYLDSAASSQRVDSVLKAVDDYERHHHANVHRGVHWLAEKATFDYEQARSEVASLIGAANSKEIVFTRNATSALNLVAHSWGGSMLKAGDEILVSQMEHHANLVPWQVLAQRMGAKLRMLPMNKEGQLQLDLLEELINERTKLVCIGMVSNALGSICDVKRVVDCAKSANALVVVDGSQALSHMAVDVVKLGCDFFAMTGHKIYGPTGIGALYGRFEHLEQMQPYETGGEMVSKVSFEHSSYQEPPMRFEAGTPNISGAVGMGMAACFLKQLSLDRIKEHDHTILNYALEKLSQIEGLKIYGRPQTGIISMNLQGIHAHDVGTILDHEGVAVRAGHHCAMPVMKFFKVPATVRMSIAVHTTKQDIDTLVVGLDRAQRLLARQ